MANDEPELSLDFTSPYGRVMDFDGYDVPAHTQGELSRYYLFGLWPGSFVNSLLSSPCDAKSEKYAAGLADEDNAWCITEISRWIREQLPSNAWGSSDRVHCYLRSFFE